MIESLVAVLLLLTIGYCVVLNQRLKRLKADEQSLKATISELITATEIAERAIAGLKMTARECEDTLGERLKAAERFCAELSRQVRGRRSPASTAVAHRGRGASAVRASRAAPSAAACTRPIRRRVAAAAQVFADARASAWVALAA